MVVNGSYWAGVLSKRLGYAVSADEPYSLPNCTSTANCVFPGGVIPQSAFSAPARGTLKFIPLPNAGGNKYVTSGQNRKVVDDKAGQRVDLLTQRTGNWFVYYMFDDATVTNPLAASSVPGFPTVTPSRAQQAVLSNTKLLGPTAVNEVRLSFTRAAVITDQPTAGFGKVVGLRLHHGRRYARASSLPDRPDTRPSRRYPLSTSASAARRLLHSNRTIRGTSPTASLRFTAGTR